MAPEEPSKAAVTDGGEEGVEKFQAECSLVYYMSVCFESRQGRRYKGHWR